MCYPFYCRSCSVAHLSPKISSWPDLTVPNRENFITDSRVLLSRSDHFQHGEPEIEPVGCTGFLLLRATALQYCIVSVSDIDVRVTIGSLH